MDTAICFIIALYATKSKTYIEITVFTTPGGYCLSGTVYAFEGEFSDKQSAIQDILDNIEEYTGKSGKERLRIFVFTSGGIGSGLIFSFSSNLKLVA
jgi:hypothetical protein